MLYLCILQRSVVLAFSEVDFPDITLLILHTELKYGLVSVHPIRSTYRVCRYTTNLFTRFLKSQVAGVSVMPSDECRG